MGSSQSLLNDVTRVFNKGNRKYVEGDLTAAKANFLQCLTMLKNSEIDLQKKRYKSESPFTSCFKIKTL